MEHILQIFQQHNLLPHFMAFLDNINNGSLSPDNIAILLALERSLLQQKESSTDMRYSAKTKQFWELLYRIGGGEIIRLLSGPKHFNMLNLMEVRKNKYFPCVGQFNFAVPHEKILGHSVFDIPKEVHPGIITECLKLVDKNSEYFLSVDGKKCVPGLKSGLENYGYGDVNLWTNEIPSLEERKTQLEKDLQQIDAILKIDLEDLNNTLFQVRQLAKTVNIISKRIKLVREAIVRHEILRKQFQKNIDTGKEKPSKYTYAFSNIDAFIISAEENIKKLLHCNQQICRIMAALNETSHLFPSDTTVDLTNQWNCNLLLTPQQINDDRFLQRNSEFIKQRTERWFDLRDSAIVTASTMCNVIGLGKAEDKNRHFNERVLRKAPKPVKPEIQAAMDHGSRHEVSILFSNCKETQSYRCNAIK